MWEPGNRVARLLLGCAYGQPSSGAASALEFRSQLDSAAISPTTSCFPFPWPGCFHLDGRTSALLKLGLSAPSEAKRTEATTHFSGGSGIPDGPSDGSSPDLEAWPYVPLIV